MHLSLAKRFPVFILASSVCWSLQCLISALTQGGKGGHLFRLTCSVMLWGGSLQTNFTGVCGECSQCVVCTGFAPAYGTCTFPVYTSQALGCSAGELSEAGPGLPALPRSKLLRFRSEQLRQQGAWRAESPQVGSASYHLPGPSCLVSWVAAGVPLSGMLCVSSWELISG